MAQQIGVVRGFVFPFELIPLESLPRWQWGSNFVFFGGGLATAVCYDLCCGFFMRVLFCYLRCLVCLSESSIARFTARSKLAKSWSMLAVLLLSGTLAWGLQGLALALPTAHNVSATVNAGQRTDLGAPTGSDPDNLGLTFRLLTQPAHGRVALSNQDGIRHFFYTSELSYSGSDSFQFLAVNSAGRKSAPATATISVVANSAPIAQNITANAVAGVRLKMPLQASDAEGDPFTFRIAGAPANGKASLSVGGGVTSLRYQSTPDFSGTATISFVAIDSKGATSAPATATVVVAANSAPVAQDVTLHTFVGKRVSVALRASDAQGDAVRFRIRERPAVGRASIANRHPSGEALFNFLLDVPFRGEIVVPFVAIDSKGAVSPPARVTIVVDNAPPVAATDRFQVEKNRVLQVAAPQGVMINDSDADGDILTAILETPPAHGALQFRADGSFDYTPQADYHGRDEWSYRVSDGTLSSAPATVKIRVVRAGTGDNHAPTVAMPITAFTTPRNTRLRIVLNGADSDGDALQYLVVSEPQHGTLTGDGPDVYYLPNPEYIGADVFTFVVSDGQAQSAPNTISIDVQSGSANSGGRDGVDASIRAARAPVWVGSGVINSTGDGQSIAPKAGSDAPAVFDIRVRNTSDQARQFDIIGPSYRDLGNWNLEYLTEQGESIGEYVVGSAQGWRSPLVQAGESLTLRVFARWSSYGPQSTPPREFSFQSFVVQNGVRQNATVDVVKALVTFDTAPRHRVDLNLSHDGESTWEGEILPVPGNPVEAYPYGTVSALTHVGLAHVFALGVKNQGPVADTFRLKLSLGVPAGWEVSLFDGADTDISAAVAGTGWQTPQLQPDEEITLRLECKPTSPLLVQLPLSSALWLPIEAVSVDDEECVDVVTARVFAIKTVVDSLFVPDNLGETIINETAQGQTVALSSRAGQTSIYRVETRVLDAPTPLTLRAPAPQAGWRVRYFDDEGGADVTDLITGAGWTTTPNSYRYLSYVYTERDPDNDDNTDTVQEYLAEQLHSSGYALRLRVEVTPLASVGTAPLQTLLIDAASSFDSSVHDVVALRVARTSAVDLMVRAARSSNVVGNNIYNATGQDQRLALTQLEGAGQSMNFVLRVENEGLSAAPFRLLAPGSGDGWSAKVFDAAQDGNDISAQISAPTGWTTPVIEAGKTLELALQIAPDAVVGAAFRDLLIRVESPTDATAFDTVIAGVAFQKIIGIEYSTDLGQGWSAAPPTDATGAANGVIAVNADTIVGLRGVRALPNYPWPYDPDVKPAWNDGGYWNVGDTIWVKASGLAQMVSAECGDTVRTTLSSDPASLYRISLRPSQTYVHVNGVGGERGDDGRTRLRAVVTDKAGQPQSGVTVRFSALFDDGSMAGTLDGSGPDHDLAVTDSDGVATLTLTSGAREATALARAFIVIDGLPAAQSPAAVAQYVVFYDEHPELNPPPDDDF